MDSAAGVSTFLETGCPIRKSPDQTPACGSPRLIAACHVLHRLPAPRHPPCALSSLTAPSSFPREAQTALRAGKTTPFQIARSLSVIALCFYFLLYPNCQRTFGASYRFGAGSPHSSIQTARPYSRAKDIRHALKEQRRNETVAPRKPARPSAFQMPGRGFPRCRATLQSLSLLQDRTACQALSSSYSARRPSRSCSRKLPAPKPPREPADSPPARTGPALLCAEEGGVKGFFPPLAREGAKVPPARSLGRQAREIQGRKTGRPGNFCGTTVGRHIHLVHFQGLSAFLHPLLFQGDAETAPTTVSM